MLIPPDRCGEVVDDMTAVIDASSDPHPDAYAYLALARLCLDEDPGPALEVARANLQQLSPEARRILEAVTAAGLPRGAELRRVVREHLSP